MSINPYAFLRTRAGLSQRKFCDKYGFAKQTLIAIEQGMYPDLSDRMTDAIFAACLAVDMDPAVELLDEYDTPYLSAAYLSWIAGEREVVDSRILDYVPQPGTPKQSPMDLLVRETVGTVQGFAKNLKVPPATLMRYMRGGQADMPVSIMQALEQAGYHHVHALRDIQEKWVATHV
jgi:transcriptional regulator with XRE-family HTH domain